MRWMLFFAVLGIGCDTKRQHRISFRVTGPSTCELYMTNTVTSGAGFNIRPPWQSAEATVESGQFPYVSLSWRPYQCPLKPDQFRCEVWLDGALWRWSDGSFGGAFRGRPLEGMCHATGEVDREPAGTWPPPTPQEQQHETELRARWDEEVAEERASLALSVLRSTAANETSAQHICEARRLLAPMLGRGAEPPSGAREAVETLRRLEREELRQQRQAARGGRMLMCCDGQSSPTCECGRRSRRGCCSHHGGVCGCEPLPTEITCPGTP